MRHLLFFLFLSGVFVIGQKPLTPKIIWSGGEFASDYVSSVYSMNDGEHFSALEGNKIVKYSYRNFEKAVGTIYESKLPTDVAMGSYTFNSDETKILIETTTARIYRRSYTAEYYIADLKSGKTEKLYDKGAQMLADFSPDGSKVAFVCENNLYYKDLATATIVQMTSDGKRNEVINGSTDWVYEEEFEVTKAFYWSPKGTRIAFLRFDESAVQDFTMEYYQGQTYPVPYTFKYPKAGEDNAKLSLHIYDLATKQTVKVDKGPMEYIPRMTWSGNDNKLVYVLLSRRQNQLVYATATWKEGKIETGILLNEESETYVEIDHNLMFLADGSGFLRTSEADGFKHIYLCAMDGKQTQITSGSWDVIELLGVDEQAKKVYYTSAEEGAIYTSVYAIGFDGKGKVKLSKRIGSNSAEFSTGMKYYINYYSNANEPSTISVHTADGGEVMQLVDNAGLKAKLADYKLSQKEFITIRGVEHDLNAYVIKPPDFDASKKYPVYFEIYNGPGSNTVSDSWSGSGFLYQQLLARNGYIVVSVDTRGTQFRGAKFKKCTYLQLGKLETEDMIAVAKQVKTWSFVDSARIGVFGWSYGGYMASLCMTKGAHVFKMGIAVAPVTNWRWYDNIYTERFMRTPQENPGGYDDNSPVNFTHLMTGNFLLIHGSGDDNVHVQNSYEMAKMLVSKNVDFEMFIYPNKSHGIGGGVTREHLYNKFLKFTLENL